MQLSRSANRNPTTPHLHPAIGIGYETAATAIPSFLLVGAL